MSPRSFWTILLKLLGVYVILQAILTIPSAISSIEFAAFSYKQDASTEYVYVVFYLLLLIGVFWLFIRLTLIKPEWTIDKLKLDKGIDENLIISMHRSDILKIVIMIIGGLTLVDSLPVLCKDVYASLQSDDYGLLRKNPSGGFIIVNLIRTAFGIFMLTSSRLIVNFIEAKRRKVIVNGINTDAE